MVRTTHAYDEDGPPYRWGLATVARRFSVVAKRPPRPEPDVEVVEALDRIVLTAHVPGFRPDALRVSVAPHRVVFTGEGRRGVPFEHGGPPPWDATVVGFEREVALGVPVRHDRARAGYRNGALEVVVPKREASVVVGRHVLPGSGVTAYPEPPPQSP